LINIQSKEVQMKKSVYLLAALVLITILAACAADAPQESSAKGSGSPAMVDGVVVETINEHQYAVVNGFYPDPCTRISDVDQVVDGKRFVISLTTDRPDDMVCAQMLEEYEVSLLLETGGLPPGEYTVEVGERETSFSLGQ
jgi:inhibitor of cysteine peptidase